MTLYEKVKERADAINMPISVLETEAGVANGTISGWKDGRPYAETLKKVADVLGTSMDELMQEVLA